MAQHYPIDNFKQKAMQKIAQSIRATRYFKGSLRYEELPAEYQETPTDRVFVTVRAVPKSIAPVIATVEIHTEPARIGRQATNIYIVL